MPRACMISCKVKKIQSSFMICQFVLGLVQLEIHLEMLMF
jgi:hypothetical protein